MRAPATRDQADAYRFGLRRLEAALVRGDPVPLHEQIRTQRRAAFAGVALGLLALCGTAVYAALVPSPAWEEQSVVVGSPSGAMYVVARHPDRLVPVANLPAARLVLAALRAGRGTEAEPSTAKPVSVPDARLDRAPRTPASAVAGAVAVRPDAVVAPRWAVCDQVRPDGALLGSTVVGGADLPAPAPAGDGVLLTPPDGSTWLVTAGRRHRVDTGDGALLAAFGLTRLLPRAADAALVSLLPEGPAFRTPDVPGRGEPAPAGLPGRIGDVLRVQPVGAAPRHLVVLAGGLQEVPDVLAELLRVASGAREARPVGAEVAAGAAFVADLAVDGWPAGAPRLRDAAESPVLCWTWTAAGGGGVWAGSTLPAPPGVAAVTLAQADGAGGRLDEVAVGAGGAVRAAGGTAPGAGPLWLVSASGVAHRVADDASASALGISGAEPAPEEVLRLLPAGPALDVADAGRVVDVPPPG